MNRYGNQDTEPADNDASSLMGVLALVVVLGVAWALWETFGQ